MNYLSLLALCSILLAMPACKNGYSSQTTTTTVAPASESVYVDKECLEEQELVEVMDNK